MFLTRWIQSPARQANRRDRKKTRHAKAVWLKPRLEALEDRAVLACMVFAQGDTLFILGDDAANVVQVAAQNTRVTVACDNAPAATHEAIRQIVADLGRGNDTLDAVRIPPPDPDMPQTSFGLVLRTGAGNDVVNVDWAAAGDDSIRVDLGDGNDVFDAVFVPPPDPDAPQGPRALRLSVQGGAGVDDISMYMGIQPTPFMPSVSFGVNVDGGAGNDTVSAQAVVLPGATQGFNPQPEPPHARFNMILNGGTGNDDISAVMGVEPTPFLPDVRFNLSMDGGANDDTLSVQANVSPGTAEGFNPQPEPPIVHFAVVMQGGAGVDDISMYMGIQPTPFLPPAVRISVAMDGGAGADTLDAAFAAYGTAQNVADLRVSLLGGDGNDALRLVWAAGAFDVDAFADGGAGFDFGVFSPGVRHVNVERLG